MLTCNLLVESTASVFLACCRRCGTIDLIMPPADEAEQEKSSRSAELATLRDTFTLWKTRELPRACYVRNLEKLRTDAADVRRSARRSLRRHRGVRLHGATDGHGGRRAAGLRRMLDRHVGQQIAGRDPAAQLRQAEGSLHERAQASAL